MSVARRFLLQLSRYGKCKARNIGRQSQAQRFLSTTCSLSKQASRSRPRIEQSSSRGKVVAAALSGGSAFLALAASQATPNSNAEVDTTGDSGSVTSKSHNVRYIRLAEVKDHHGSSGTPWVTKGDSVYDITDWVGAHPGGEVILRAAGGSIDPYWEIFSIHKKQDVYDILEEYFIGKIDPQDLVDGQVPADSVVDPFKHDPDRDNRLRFLTPRPCNAETPSEGLTEFNTPTELFYVRNHMWVPTVEDGEYEVTIELPDGEEVVYTLGQLKEKFKSYKITATLQCAGNRRKDMTANAKATNGLQWTAGAISSAEWEGVRLRDVLQDAGLDVSDPPDDAQHAQFTGLEAYGASIPIDKAIDRRGDVILAYKMNGIELPPDHGYPLRVIVPGNVAARSVKWLRKIVISDEESQTQWQRRDYRNFGPNITHPDWPTGTSIQEMPITSAITGINHPSHSTDEEETHPLSIEGYAYSGGGREIIRVDISQDEGKTWDQADLIKDEYMGSKAWCWKRWRYTGVRNISGKTSFLVKATDNTYNTQPQSYTSIFNPRGNLATAWHRVEYDGDEDEEKGLKVTKKEENPRSKL